MSIAVLNSTYQHLPALRDSIAQLPDKRRPGWANTVAVALLLADRYQDKRGYVDETVGQVAGALCLSENTVRSVLTALDQVSFWERTVKGNQYRGSRRVPSFMQRGADPTTQVDGSESEQRGAAPACSDESDDGASRGSRLSIAGYDLEQRGADPTTPHSSTDTSPSSTHGFNSGEGNLLDEDISELRVLRITRLVTDTPDQLIAAEVRHVLTEHTSWPNQDIADRVAAMPHVVAR